MYCCRFQYLYDELNEKKKNKTRKVNSEKKKLDKKDILHGELNVFHYFVTNIAPITRLKGVHRSFIQTTNLFKKFYTNSHLNIVQHGQNNV